MAKILYICNSIAMFFAAMVHGHPGPYTFWVGRWVRCHTKKYFEVWKTRAVFVN